MPKQTHMQLESSCEITTSDSIYLLHLTIDIENKNNIYILHSVACILLKERVVEMIKNELYQL